jgi:quercetin 2,3-dioxygenase
MYGFQLWANLPRVLKMTAPRYQEVKADEIPEVTETDGTCVRVVCGDFAGTRGPVASIAADPVYLDVSIAPGTKRSFQLDPERHAFAYVFEGSGTFSNESGQADNRSLVLFDAGDEVAVQAGSAGVRFLLVSGKPLREPVAWNGPIVMNTQEELRQAFEELEKGTFLKP